MIVLMGTVADADSIAAAAAGDADDPRSAPVAASRLIRIVPFGVFAGPLFSDAVDSGPA